MNVVYLFAGQSSNRIAAGASARLDRRCSGLNTRYHRPDDGPADRVFEGEVLTSRFNLFRLAVLRLGNPLRLALPALRVLRLDLDSGSWTVPDAAPKNIRVVARTHVRSLARNHRRHPITCRISHCEAGARLVTESAFETTVAEIETRPEGSALPLGKPVRSGKMECF